MFAGTEGGPAVVPGQRDVELAEVGTRDWELVRVVMYVTEISEEGIFRHVVTYL